MMAFFFFIPRYFGLVGFILVFGLGLSCDRRHRPTGDDQPASGALTFELVPPALLRTPSVASKESPTQGRFVISGPDMIPINRVFQAVEGRISGRIEGIPIGRRQVEFSWENRAGTRLWGANTEVTILKDQDTRATLTLERVGDLPPEIQRVTITPVAGLVHTAFTLQATLEDIHDATDSLEVRWDVDSDGLFEINWTTDKSTSYTFDGTGSFTVRVVARDRTLKENTATVVVEVFDLQPQIGATTGRDTVFVGPEDPPVELDGRLSQGRSGQPLVYRWDQVRDVAGAIQGSALDGLSDNNSTTADRVLFDPPQGRGVYVFTLQVEDAALAVSNAARDTVVVIVRSAPPVAVIDPNIVSIELGQSVVLHGQGTDADGDALVYRWEGEGVGLLTDASDAMPTFTPARVGDYRFTLIVSDTDPQDSAPAEVVVTVMAPPVTDAGADLTFADEKLEAAVRRILEIPARSIRPADVVDLDSLDLEVEGIARLDGLEAFTGLIYLNLSANTVLQDLTPLAGLSRLQHLVLNDNQIQDLTPLSNLTNLQYLVLWSNRIEDIGPLASLTQVQHLWLGGNDIRDVQPLTSLTALSTLWLNRNFLADITPLAGLVNLTELMLFDNQLTDVRPLANLSELAQLELQNNQLTDVAALVDNTGLGEGDVLNLQGNSLSQTALNEQIPVLEARGVEVLFDAADNAAPIEAAGVVYSINGPVQVTGVGPGASVAIELFAAGMKEVKQFQWTIEVVPLAAFADLNEVTYSGVDGFITPFLEITGNSIRTGGAHIGSNPLNGDASLGTLTLKMAADFSTGTAARIRIVEVSIGPSSSERDVQSAETTGLDLQVIIN